MDIKYHDIGFPFIEIQNTYDDNELELIWEELNFLCYSDKLKGPEETGAAFEFDQFGNKYHTKNNRGILIDTVYSERTTSNILTCNRKLFNIVSKAFLETDHWFYKRMKITEDYTLLSYYENNQYYGIHNDNSIITALTWFYKEPKKFEGGDLGFSDFNYIIPVKNNYTILFPGIINHFVTSVTMDEKNLNKKYGRFCMSQFLYNRRLQS